MFRVLILPIVTQVLCCFLLIASKTTDMKHFSAALADEFTTFTADLQSENILMIPNPESYQWKTRDAT